MGSLISQRQRPSSILSVGSFCQVCLTLPWALPCGLIASVVNNRIGLLSLTGDRIPAMHPARWHHPRPAGLGYGVANVDC